MHARAYAGAATTARIDDLADGSADSDRLAGMAMEAIKHAVDRRADRVVVEMSLGEVDQRVGRLDLAFGFGDRLGAGPDHHHL